MARKWNGSSLTTDLRAELWQAVSAARVTGWINDALQDIADRQDWIALRRTGQKVLTASVEEQDLNLSAPTAVTLTAVAGGNLTAASTYSVRVTFYESSSGRESIQGAESNTVTTTTANKALTMASIPVSSDPDVTARKIYLSKDGGSYLFQQSIDDNTTTSAVLSTLAIDYSGDGSGFTESGSDTDFSGASAALSTLTAPADEIFYASFSSSLNAERSDGSSTGVSGSATITGGKLDMTGYVSTEHLKYTSTAGALVPVQTGCFECRLTPNWTGNPAENQYIFEMARAAGGGPDRIRLFYDTSGNWRLTINNSGGFLTIDETIADTGRFTSGTEVHISLNFDVTNGVTELYIDGAKVGSTIATTMTRSGSTVDTLILGSSIPASGSNDPNFFMRDFRIHDAVQRTAAFTAPTYGYLYPVAAGKVAYNTSVEAVGMQGLTETITTPGTTSVQYTMTIEGVEYYVPAGVWTVSDGTQAQSSTAAEFNTAAATFPAGVDEVITTISAFLLSSDGLNTPTITTLVLDYFPEGAIEDDATSTVEPPDYNQISKIDGNLWDAANNYPLQYVNHRHLKQTNAGGSTGTPTAWSQINEGKVALSPSPSTASTVGFYYFKVPATIYATTDSQPDLPVGFRRAIESYVIMRGYKYLDRDGAEMKERDYLQALEEAKRSMNNRARRVSSVRERNGDTFGSEVH